MEIDPNSGFAPLTIGTVKQEVDVYKLWAQLDEMRAQTDGQSPAEFWEKVTVLLVDLGFPKVSHYAANRFVQWHNQLVASLGKAEQGESKPDSPASTEPLCSTSPTA